MLKFKISLKIYRSCSPYKCFIDGKANKCPVKFLIKQCIFTDKNEVDIEEHAVHLNLNQNAKDSIRGIHIYYKQKLLYLYKEDKRTPKVLLNILLEKFRVDNIPLPDLKQVQNLCYNNNKKSEQSNQIIALKEY